MRNVSIESMSPTLSLVSEETQLKFEDIFKIFSKLYVNYVIAGSYLSSVIHNKIVKTDFLDTKNVDIFLLNPTVSYNSIIEEIKKTYTRDSIKTNFSNYHSKYNSGLKVYNSFIVDKTNTLDPMLINFILTNHTKKENLIRSIDFLHCRINFHNGKLYLTENMLDACLNKKLIKAPDYPFNIVDIRRMKFVHRGFYDLTNHVDME